MAGPSRTALKKLLTPFRVGLLVIASVGFLVAFLVFVRHGTLRAESITVYAMFRDASGWEAGRVQVARHRGGDIQDIALVGTRARVKLRLRRTSGCAPMQS